MYFILYHILRYNPDIYIPSFFFYNSIFIVKPIVLYFSFYSLNSTTIASKINSSSKTVLKVNSALNKNVSNIPKAVARPTTVGLHQLNSGTLIRRNRPVSKIIKEYIPYFQTFSKLHNII